jgi:hypothetical protein
MTLINIVRDEINALDDAELLELMRVLHARKPVLSAEHEALNESLLSTAERDLSRSHRFRKRGVRNEARGRLRTYCVALRMSEERRQLAGPR